MICICHLQALVLSLDQSRLGIDYTSISLKSSLNPFLGPFNFTVSKMGNQILDTVTIATGTDFPIAAG